LLETLSNPTVLVGGIRAVSDNPIGAENQQERLINS
jgi:hypothetical protein